MSVILNVAFVGASILSLACTGRLGLGLAFLAVFVIISVKTQFSDQGKVRDFQDFFLSLYLLAQCFHHFLDLHLIFFQ